ncbi:hypothetical protein [Streptomyces sp. NPDC059513]|uniref:hypothetical protein n=1 Tax=unclassified Streptomyces TaxID=2593676 RepID=UPI0036BD8A70
MTEPDKPRQPEPGVPPMETIDDSQRIPRPRKPSAPRTEPIRTVDDVPAGAIAAFAVVGIGAVILTLKWGVPKVIDWSHHQDWSWFTQWIATIADPVHAYLTAHTAGLPLTASSAFVIWQAVGVASLALSWLTGAVGARLTWIAHGTCSVLMVWDASPAVSRPVAAALAVLAWTIGSFFALRGLSLRPLINIHTHNHPAR